MVNACQIFVLLCTVPGLFAAAFPQVQVLDDVDVAADALEFPTSRVTRGARGDVRRSKPALDDRFATAWFTSQSEDESPTMDLGVLFPIGSLPTFRGLPKGCSCFHGSQYNLVCGTDDVTYQNEARLNCFRRCENASLRVKYSGACVVPPAN